VVGPRWIFLRQAFLSSLTTPIMTSPDISIVIPTYNRQQLLAEAVNSVLSQECGNLEFELIVVDNNSSDHTNEIVQSLVSKTPDRLRYLLEARQGVSHARNLGIASARAPVIAFLDDDVRAASGWIKTIQRAFLENPKVGFIGGKVIAEFTEDLPPWLTRDHWAPLALLDHGDCPITIVSPNGVGLITANCAVRRSVFERAGCFRPELQRIGDGVGSMEDHELFERFLASGIEGLYRPDLIVSTEIPAARLTKAYHRHWHFRHGGFYALYQSNEFERTSHGRLFGVPAHLYRQAAVDGFSYVKHSLLGKRDQAFTDEIRLRFFGGFFSRRIRSF